MTVLEQMVRAVSTGDNGWAQVVAARTTRGVNASGVDWGRKGGSWGKEGEFWKK
ncbi:multiple cyclophane-containing RiPP AmcA [Lentzea sp. NPDC006480]|uniref:multiple cyclophane-containing RiPP AmcA n=1 Tax=Lentzea sp. NPDC006480 TaxID=3157176 RepID=UPI0033B20FE9